MLSQDYQTTHDIDWFCVINTHHVHVASNGNSIPKHYENKTFLMDIQRQVYAMPLFYDYELNRGYLERVFSDGRLAHVTLLDDSQIEALIPMEIDFGNKKLSVLEKAYCWSFIEMAQKGFYSYDTDQEGYHLIAYPQNIDSEEIEYPPQIPRLTLDDYNEQHLSQDLVNLINNMCK